MYELLNKLKKKIEINDELLKVLIHSLREIIDFANYHNIPLYELHSIAKNLDKIQMLLREEETMARESMDFTKQCPICGKLNPEDAKYCAYCGTTLGVITRIRHDDKSPKDATEPSLFGNNW